MTIRFRNSRPHRNCKGPKTFGNFTCDPFEHQLSASCPDRLKTARCAGFIFLLEPLLRSEQDDDEEFFLKRDDRGVHTHRQTDSVSSFVASC